MSYYPTYNVEYHDSIESASSLRVGRLEAVLQLPLRQLHPPLELHHVRHDVLEGELRGLLQERQLGVEALEVGVLLLDDGGEVVDNVLLLVGRLGDGERVQGLQLEPVARPFLLRVHVVAERQDQLQDSFQLL